MNEAPTPRPPTIEELKTRLHRETNPVTRSILKSIIRNRTNNIPLISTI